MRIPDLSIITVTWNSAAFIEKQIQSVALGATKYAFEQIVIDNGSSDATAEMLAKNSGVKHILNTENRGFAAANNQGFEIARGRYVLFLNPDMEVLPGTLDALVDWMDAHPTVGIAGPQLVDTQRKEQLGAGPRRFPKTWEQLAVIFKLPHVFPAVLGSYYMKGVDLSHEQSVDSVRGSCMIVRRDFLDQLGFAFDPRYFIWFDDVDLCREAYTRGWDVCYVPTISCIDHVGQSFGQQFIVEKQKRFNRAMLAYFQKWEPWWKWMWIWLAQPVGLFAGMLATRFRFEQKIDKQ